MWNPQIMIFVIQRGINIANVVRRIVVCGKLLSTKID